MQNRDRNVLEMNIAQLDALTGAISPVEGYLRRLLQEVSGNRDGTVADYIPELAKANP